MHPHPGQSEYRGADPRRRRSAARRRAWHSPRKSAKVEKSSEYDHDPQRARGNPAQDADRALYRRRPAGGLAHAGAPGGARALQPELRSNQDPKQLIEAASHILSDVSKLAGIVMVPRREEQVSFRHIDFLGLGARRVMVVLVTPARPV